MGRFIVLEGLDGAGTTTQRGRVTEWLRSRGKTVVETFEPTDGFIGREIRRVLRREEGAVHRSTLPWMFAADRADHLSRLVDPALQRGEWVISDRYLHSSLAYQSLDRALEEVWELNHRFRAPDLTLFVAVSVDTCLERMARRGGTAELFEQREALQRVAASYERVMARLQERGDTIVRIDGDAPIESVTTAIQNAMSGVLEV
ncbi:MAG: dTMP kinase [Myxococcota bacterium]